MKNQMKKKKKFLFYLILIMSMAFTSPALAMLHTFMPDDSGTPDLWNISHGEYCIWGMDFTLNRNERIKEARLIRDDICNWCMEPNGLYFYPMDAAASGTHRFTHSIDSDYDQFRGMGKLLYLWENISVLPHGIEYIFSAEEIGILTVYLTDSNFGKGFDSDCHFFNNGNTPTLETAAASSSIMPVPEPATLLLFGTGLIVVFRKRNNKSK